MLHAQTTNEATNETIIIKLEELVRKARSIVNRSICSEVGRSSPQLHSALICFSSAEGSYMSSVHTFSKHHAEKAGNLYDSIVTFRRAIQYTEGFFSENFKEIEALAFEASDLL